MSALETLVIVEYNRIVKIEWVEEADLPINQGDRISKYAEFAKALMKNPGRWAKWPTTYMNPTASSAVGLSIRNHTDRAPKPFRTGKWDTRIANKTLYVRYLGE